LTRIIAATNKDLTRVKDGTFREDLFYRLSVVPIQILPFAKESDIPSADQILEKYTKEEKYKRDFQEVKVPLLNTTGQENVRELENAIERAIVLTETDNRTLRPHVLRSYTDPVSDTQGGSDRNQAC
jgi:transcriptional regulator with GAF, ATPase, and Fis domain